MEDTSGNDSFENQFGQGPKEKHDETPASAEGANPQTGITFSYKLCHQNTCIVHYLWVFKS